MRDATFHGDYSPSQAERFFLCPGSVALSRRVPKRAPSEYAIEGTKAHEVLETAIRNGYCDAQTAHKHHSVYKDEELHTGYNQFYTAINEALDCIKGILAEDAASVIYTETRVYPLPISKFGDIAEHVSGPSDAFIWQPTLQRVIVVDYKHGVETVEVEFNKQLSQYATGVLFDERNLVPRDQVKEVHLVIIQPRAFHKEGSERTWVCEIADMHAYGASLIDAVEECENLDAALVPGEKQCRWCPANHMCSAREAMALRAVGDQYRNIMDIKAPNLPSGDQIDTLRLSQILKAKPYLIKWLDDIANYAEELMRHGHSVPGQKLVEASAKREWHLSDEETAAKLAALTGLPVEDMWRKKLQTITDSEKLVVNAYKRGVARNKKKERAEEAKKAFAYLTTKKSSGKLSMVDESDKRPSVGALTSAFSHLQIAPPPSATGE